MVRMKPRSISASSTPAIPPASPRSLASSVRTWGEALEWGTDTLTRAGSPSPHLDALSLLMRALSVPHAVIANTPDHPFSPAGAQTYLDWVRRRSGGEPVAYITGHKAFMGLDLMVDQRVFLVRPNTQVLVQTALEIARLHPAHNALQAADIGTGCGAIALALACLEPRFTRIYAVDASPDALCVARRNGARYGLGERVIWLQGDLLAPLPEPVDLIVASLPSLPEQGVSLAPEVARYEPSLAFFSGQDGLDLIRSLIEQAMARLRPGGALGIEIQPPQRGAVQHLLARAFPSARIWAGQWNGLDCMVCAQLEPDTTNTA
jgi:release factor glutamine methyltransferase